MNARSKAEVMPILPDSARWRAWTDWTAFGILSMALAGLHWLFLVGIVLGIARLLMVGALALYQKWRERHERFDPAYAPTVAVVVPAYNEEKVIVQTVASLLASTHPPAFEILVVDDGSSDRTVDRLREAFWDEPRVKVFTKPNAGKADALVPLTRSAIASLVEHLLELAVAPPERGKAEGRVSELEAFVSALETLPA
jgi:hypothetical protein